MFVQAFFLFFSLRKYEKIKFVPITSPESSQKVNKNYFKGNKQTLKNSLDKWHIYGAKRRNKDNIWPNNSTKSQNFCNPSELE